MKDGDVWATEFASTTAGLQAAIDYLAGGKGKVFIGPGTLDVTTAIYPHSNCHIQGAGIGATVIQRASGSLTAADASYTGNLFLPTPYGTNGSPATSAATAVSNITISDITLDGNYTAFGGINPATPRHMALYAVWCNGVWIKNVECKNFLQTAIQFDTCRKCFVSDSFIYYCGQYTSASSRNGINFINNQTGLADDFGRYLNVSNVYIDQILDEGFSISNTEWVVIENCIVNNVDIVIELEGGTYTTTAGHYKFNNITAKNNRGEFFKWAPTSAGITLSDVAITNCSMEGHATLHITDVIGLGQGSSADKGVQNIAISNCIFTNCNSGDASGRNFVRISATSTSPSKNITISDCTWQHGLTTSTRTDCDGIRVFASVDGLKISDCNIRDAAGRGILFEPIYAAQSNVEITNCLISNCTHDGIYLVNDSLATTMKQFNLSGVTVLDCCEQTGSIGISLSDTFAGSSMSGVFIRGCRVVRTGSNAIVNGLKLLQSGTGAMSSVATCDNDFTGCTGTNITTSGTITDLRYNETLYQSTPSAGILSSEDITIQSPGNELKFTASGTTSVWNSNAAGALALGGWGDSSIVVVGNGGNFVDVDAPLHVTTGVTTLDNGLVVGGGGTVLKILTGTASLNFDLSAVVSQDLTITVTGAVDGNPVFIGVPLGSVTADTGFFGWVSAADTVTVRAFRLAGAPNPASGTFRATVFKY